MKKVWGPNIWLFLHCFCDKINNDYFIKNRTEVFNFIKNIMFNLPCPICSSYTRLKFKKVNFSRIKTKEDLKLLMFYYHNDVNKKLKKNQKSVDILNTYKKYSIYKCYKNFLKHFNKKYKTRLTVYSQTYYINNNTEKLNVIKWWNNNYKLCF
tara:strand:- start:32 stop:490 length:459 start_codon:yes stop_codon:yes gene_type:complete